MITFDQFLEQVDKTFMSHKGKNKWRYGQTVMNVLWRTWPNKYKEIQGSDFDCFYDNSTVQSTLNKLEKEWHT
jgi:hypothetical protein